jgi:hypothetical protein
MVVCNQQARDVCVAAMLRQCWGKWLQRCEHNEEIALGGLTRRARAHAASKLMHAVLGAWVVYIVKCRHRQRLEMLADAHFRECALPRCVVSIGMGGGGGGGLSGKLPCLTAMLSPPADALKHSEKMSRSETTLDT